MKRVLLTVVAGIALAVSASSSAGNSIVHATLLGTCTTTNRVDSNAVVLSSVVTCTMKAYCACNGQKFQLSYNSSWKSAGNGGPGHEKGQLVARNASATVTLWLSGRREGDGTSSGTWILGKVTGLPKQDFQSHGTYTSLTEPNGSEFQPTVAARVTAAIGCWSCG